MGRSSVRGGGVGRHRDDRASDLGWDDSLYEDGRGRRLAAPPRQRGYVPSDDDGYYDDDEYDDYADGPPRRRRRWLRWFVGVLAFLILGTAGAGWWYYQELNNNLDKGSLNLGDNKLDKKAPNAAGQTPMNILLLGSDDRSSDENVKLGGAKKDRNRPPLADVQMLVHVSADRSNMSVVSIPRDTLVTIPKCRDDKEQEKTYPEAEGQTINTALQHGGPGCVVATWEKLTGIPIDHYMMIDFSGVVSMADAVGGVPVCVEANVRDKDSGLKLEKGETVVKGEQALQWLRTRHAFEDGSDIGRTHAQHQYMNSMVRELKAGTKLTDPGKMNALAQAATNALAVDEGLGTVKKLYDLGNDLKRVPSKRITMTTMPFIYSPRDPARVEPKKGDAEKIWQLIRDDIAFDGKDKKKKAKVTAADAEPAAEIPVTVQNGTQDATLGPADGRAGAITEQLSSLGFTQAEADTTLTSHADTTITYGSDDQRANALAVAKAVGLPERAVRKSADADQVTLVIGGDWRQGTTYPKAAADAAEADKAPDSANPLNGEDKSACMAVNVKGGYSW